MGTTLVFTPTSKGSKPIGKEDAFPKGIVDVDVLCIPGTERCVSAHVLRDGRCTLTVWDTTSGYAVEKVQVATQNKHSRIVCLEHVRLGEGRVKTVLATDAGAYVCSLTAAITTSSLAVAIRQQANISNQYSGLRKLGRTVVYAREGNWEKVRSEMTKLTIRMGESSRLVPMLVEQDQKELIALLLQQGNQVSEDSLIRIIRYGLAAKNFKDRENLVRQAMAMPIKSLSIKVGLYNFTAEEVEKLLEALISCYMGSYAGKESISFQTVMSWTGYIVDSCLLSIVQSEYSMELLQTLKLLIDEQLEVTGLLNYVSTVAQRCKEWAPQEMEDDEDFIYMNC